MTYDPHYWHPDGAPPGQAADLPRATYGFPTVPGLLDACRAQFRATGLRTPWLTTFGNHDGLMQGNLPSSPQVAGPATGPVKFVDLPPGTDIVTVALGLQQLDPAAFATLFEGPVRLVTPDADRRPLSRLETIQEHFDTSGSPRGHGYRPENLKTGNAYYAFDNGPVRGLALDTVNPFGRPRRLHRRGATELADPAAARRKYPVPGRQRAPPRPGPRLADPLTLAALSRELAANDWQRPAPTATEEGRRGALEDRNVELLVAAPFALR